MNASVLAPARSAPARHALPIRGLGCFLLPLFLLSPSAGLAATADDALDGARGETAAVQLPPFPQAENLIPFTVSATTDNKFMIDGESLSVSPERQVSYTLVIVSPAGAQNVSYEAMRCATGEYRLYALGRSDGTWAKARNDQWKRVQESTRNRHHAALFADYFCSIGTNLRDADDARRILRTGGNRSYLRP